MDKASLENVRIVFNEKHDTVRVVSLLSPTCLVCQYGQGVVRTLFDLASDAGLWGLIGWIPMMDADSEAASELEVQAFSDARVHHVWDGQRALGSAFAKTLALEGPAWDVYLLYGRGVMWTDTIPPPPTFWMHQLPSRAKANPTLLLHPGRFARKMSELLGRDSTEIPVDMALFLHAKGLSTVKTERQQPQPTLEEVTTAAMSK